MGWVMRISTTIYHVVRLIRLWIKKTGIDSCGSKKSHLISGFLVKGELVGLEVGFVLSRAT